MNRLAQHKILCAEKSDGPIHPANPAFLLLSLGEFSLLIPFIIYAMRRPRNYLPWKFSQLIKSVPELREAINTQTHPVQISIECGAS